MPKKYHIHAKVTPLNLDYIYKFTIERGENCINCGKCTKVCIYEAHKRGKGGDPRKMADPTQWFVETVLGAFRNVPAERWKNLWIRTF